MKRSKKCGFGFLETEPKFFTCYQPDIPKEEENLIAVKGVDGKMRAKNALINQIFVRSSGFLS
jgi:hypothetical protein